MRTPHLTPPLYRTYSSELARLNRHKSPTEAMASKAKDVSAANGPCRYRRCAMNNPFDLSGRVALVTGGNGGIGFGMAEGLAAAGAAIMIAGRDSAKSEAAVA